MNVTHRVMAKLAAKNTRDNPCVAKVHGFDTLFDGQTARVHVTFNGNFPQHQMREALACALDYKATPVEASFRLTPHSGTLPSMVGFVVPNNPIMTSEEIAQRVEAETLVETAANMFMAPEDESIWSRPEGADYLVREQQEDLSDLLTLASVRHVGHDNIKTIASAHARYDEAIAYVDPQAGIVRTAIALQASTQEIGDKQYAGTISFDVESKETVFVPACLVVQAAKVPAINDDHKEVAGSYDASKLLDFYKKVYEYDPNWQSMFDAIIKQHAAM